VRRRRRRGGGIRSPDRRHHDAGQAGSGGRPAGVRPRRHAQPRSAHHCHDFAGATMPRSLRFVADLFPVSHFTRAMTAAFDPNVTGGGFSPRRVAHPRGLGGRRHARRAVDLPLDTYRRPLTPADVLVSAHRGRGDRSRLTAAVTAVIRLQPPSARATAEHSPGPLPDGWDDGPRGHRAIVTPEAILTPTQGPTCRRPSRPAGSRELPS
jgi:hypothetical protein